MCQLVLPGMREQGWGKIVNISSMGANFVFPGGGFYHATKYALDAISDALRFEVKGFGVDVVIIQPGLITTEFGDAATARDRRARPSEDGGPYATFNATAREGDRRTIYEQRPAGQARRPARGGGQGHREGDHRQAAEAALPRHAVGAPARQPAPAHDRPHVGRDDAHAVPSAEG